jgi:hypothetical protein
MENVDLLIVTVGSASMLVLELVKLIIKKLGGKPDFGFSTSFYLISLPILNALVPFPLQWLGFHISAPTLSMGWLDLVKYLVSILIASAISLLVYNNGVKPLKEYAKLQTGLKEAGGIDVNKFG